MINKLQPILGAIAQLGERNTGSVEVSGSIPLSSTNEIKDLREIGVLFLCLKFPVGYSWETFDGCLPGIKKPTEVGCITYCGLHYV
jgi:hypothetical protein